MTSLYSTVYEILAREFQRFSVTILTLATILLREVVASTDFDIIVSISPIATSTLCFRDLLTYIVLKEYKKYYSYWRQTLTAIMEQCGCLHTFFQSLPCHFIEGIDVRHQCICMKMRDFFGCLLHHCLAGLFSASVAVSAYMGLHTPISGHVKIIHIPTYSHTLACTCMYNPYRSLIRVSSAEYLVRLPCVE